MRTTLLWLINKWRPNFSFNIRSFKALFAVSSKLLFAGILTQLSQNVFSTIIGKVFTTNDVGYYSQGRKLQQRIGDFITYSIQNVLVPVQTLLKDDVPRLKNALRTNVKITTLVAFPAIAGLIAIAKPFVILALTIKWLPSIDYIYILSVAGIFFAISIAISSFLLPIGKNNFIVGLTSFSSLALLAFVTIGVWLKVDLKLLVASKVLHEFIILLLVLFASNRFINYRIIEVIKDILPQTIFSSIMGLVVYSIGNIFGVSFFIFALQVISGGILYLLLNYYFNRKMFIEIKTFSKSLMNSQKHN